MRVIVPDYYKEFSCIAGACRHSCCIGWEIDIDEESMARFDALDTPYGNTLRARIDRSGEVPHYRLGEGDRCPFLRADGLCEMILELGEDALCQICTDHPRFRNYFSDRTELGLGLCCEAAGELILKREAPVTLEILEDDAFPDEPDEEEETLLSFRDMLFSILQDRSCTLDERLEELCSTCGCAAPAFDGILWAQRFQQLERLDEGWTDILRDLEGQMAFDDPALHTPQWEIAFEQAAVYFLFRHLSAALEDGDISSKAAFAVLSVEFLRALCAGKAGCTLDDLVEFARMYSSEIEYSEENLAQVFTWLSE